MDINPACTTEHLNTSGGELLRLVTLMAVGWAWVAGGVVPNRPTCTSRPTPSPTPPEPRSLRAAWVLATVGLLPLVAVGGTMGPQLANAGCVLLFALRRGGAPLGYSVLVLALNTTLTAPVYAPWLFVVNVFIGWWCP